jgi:hypothetical protein
MEEVICAMPDGCGAKPHHGYLRHVRRGNQVTAVNSCLKKVLALNHLAKILHDSQVEGFPSHFLRELCGDWRFSDRITCIDEFSSQFSNCRRRRRVRRLDRASASTKRRESHAA